MDKCLKYTLQTEIEKLAERCDDEFKHEYDAFIGIIDEIRKNRKATPLQLVELENIYNYKTPLIEFVFMYAYNMATELERRE
ncbi:hypothetical protein M5X00_06330 [Paenibacillus alvei]|uniref:Phage protein n=2 Tax=Paenibacillus alvei TaxID=44250 RepID=A0ABT4H7P0_PAEAL|nr:hypothetical protein [Paenibacillus alvei]EJW14878.1 hypothetical protein PAV_11c02190 [Paenibacillus alvei DSM 29]MCY9708396.1 hypothetical protein [Paenibacillus alvei]MCY9732278.1 hypothetical protein [Paenibacillus alvei]MCY9753873.1 hypothetical protein [Paenibacillus alvei]MCY9764992.1 hypothetical protein [Paenibacillus alvei]